jgi:hypothetical protein
MNFIAALLYIVMRDEEETFWMLVAVIEDLLPANFYTSQMLSLQVRGQVQASDLR